MSIFDPAVWFVAPLVGAAAILLLLPVARSRGGVVALGFLSLAGVVISFVSTALWGWLLRDGLGPDMVESHGVQAAWRFLADSGPALLIALGAGVLSWRLCVARYRQCPAERQRTS